MRQIIAVSSCMLKELLRKKDFYVLFIMMGIFLTFFASQSFFGIEGVSRYVIDIGYSISIFFSVIIAVVTAARQLPSEIASRTIYPLLAKPISRSKIIIAKFFGSLGVSIVSFSMFFAVFLFFYVDAGYASSVVLVAQSYIMGCFLMCMVTSLTVFLSNFLTLSANVTITFLIFVVSVNFFGSLRKTFISAEGILSFLTGAVYYLFPHFEFYDMRIRVVHVWGDLPTNVVFAITVYTLAYCCALLVLSGAVFKRRPL